jgi:type I restriction enzyme S subunit
VSWQDCTLGDVLTLKRGHDLPERERIPGDVPVVSSSGITGYHNEAKAEPPGVVTGRYGTIGEVFFVDEPYWPLNTALYVVDFKGTNPKFAAYLLRHTLRNYQSEKAAVPGVDRNVLHTIKVRAPGANEQAAVVSVLSAYDDLIENNRRRIALLEEAARLLYREWFVHFRFPGHEHVRIIDGLPEGWKRRAFDSVCDTIGGGTPKTEKPEFWNDGDIPWYKPTDITRNSCLALLDSATKITEAGLRGSSAKMLPAGTVLMTSRASVGFFGVIDEPSCTNQGFISIIPHDSQARMYLLHNLMHRVEEIRSHAGGATYKEISKGKFRALPVVVPDAPLVHEFEGQASTLHAQVRTLHTQNQKLAQGRDLLLPHLMNGEIAV